MSKQVEERVLEMRFDNRHFENNVKTTMSTLDRLKQSLQLKGAEKGLENVNAASKKVDMTHLGKGLETVQAKFSALQVIGVTALSNITNSAINAGKRIVESLTIAPIKDGFSEYEMTLNAVQTTMAGTGKTAEEVEKQLKKLDEYADKTVYSTSDMLNNLPKFTNAGVELEKATTAMIGIANATALAGGDASKASIAFYNLGQAIGTGYLTRMDYNSINNAGIATMEWKNQMVEAAIAQGTLTKVGENAYKAGKKTFTLQQLFIDGLQEQWATTDVMMKVFGDYGDETTEIGKKAQASAQDIKTFTQMMESLKATAGTGWKDTWQLIFGGLDEAKEFWTGLSEFISGIITKMADARNALLESALGKTFTGLSEKISGLLGPAKKASETVQKVTNTVKDLGAVVDRVILGEFGNGEKRFKALSEAGYDYAEVQNKVNEKLGNSFRYATKNNKAQGESVQTQVKLNKQEAKRLEQLTDMSDAQLKNLGYTEEQIKAIRELKNEADKLGIPVAEFIGQLDELNGRTILINSFKNIGQGLVSVFKSLKDAWVDIFPPMTGDQLYNIIAGFHKLSTYLVVGEDTADKLTRTFKGLFAALDIILTIVGGPIKLAFKVLTQLLSVFDLDILDITAAIGDAIVGFRDWLDSVLDFTEIFEKIKPALSKFIDNLGGWISDIKSKFGEVASNIIQGLKDGIGSGAKAVWDSLVNLGKRILEAIKGVLGINSPSKETYEIGKNLIEGLINGLGDGVSALYEIIKNIGSKVIDAFKNFNWGEIAAGIRLVASFLPKLPGMNQFAAIATWAGAAGHDTVEGLVNGLKDGISKVASVVLEIGKTILNTIKNVLGIHSPSKEMEEVGGNTISGFFNGLQNGFSKVIDFFKNLGKKCMEIISKIDFGKVFSIALSAGVLILAKKAFDVFEKFADIADSVTAPLKGLGKMLSGLGSMFTDLGKKFKAQAWQARSKAILNMAIAIGIMAASVYMLAKIPWQDLLKGVGAIAALAGVTLLLSKAAEKISANDGDFGKFSLMLLGISASVWIMASALKKLEFLNGDNVGYVLGGLAAMIIGLGAVMAAFGQFVKGKAAQNIDKAGGVMVKMSIALLLMIGVIKLASKLDQAALVKGGIVMIMFAGLVTGLIAATKLGGKSINKAGGMILKVSAAMLLMVAVVKLCSGMEPAEITKGMICIALFGGLIVGLVAATKLAGGNSLAKLGSTLMAMSGSILLLVLTAKILARMEPAELTKGIICIALFGGIVTGLVAATRLAGGGELKRVASTLLAMSISIGVLAAIAVVLSLVDLAGLAKGIIAVGLLSGLMSLMIYATKDAQDCKGNITAMAIAIGVMALAVAGLSFIDPKSLAVSVAALSVLMGMFALMIKASANAQKAVGPLIVMTAAIGILAGALWLITALPVDKVLPSALALSTLMLALSGAMVIISKVGSISTNTVAALGVMTLALGVLAGALWLISGLPIANAIAGAVALGGLMLALSGAMVIISNVGTISTNTVAALGIMTVALGILAGALWLISGLPIASALAGALSLSVLMLALAGSMLIISNVGGSALAGAAALLAIAGALAILTPCIQQLGSMSLAEIGKGLLALAGAFAVIGVAGLLLGPIAPAILMLAGAITLIGVGCLAAGAGVQMFVGALTQFMMTAILLQGQGPAIAAGITAMITGICLAISNSASAICAAITSVILSITQALITSIPAIMNCLGVMLTSFLTFLVQAVPQFVNAGLQIITGILRGIADNIGGIIKAATDIIVNFLNGIAAGLPRIIDSGIKLMISFINGMADGIRNNTPAIISAVNNLMDAVIGAIKSWFSNAVSKGGELVGKLISGVKSKFSAFKGIAKDMMDGFIKGVGEKFGAIKQKAVDAVSGAVDAVKNFLGIKSPSRVFAEMGRYSDEGFAVGLKKYASVATRAAGDLGVATLNGLKDSLDINSPARVVRDEVGKYVVEGLAEGITKDMSAEEAAKKKADNIVSAFKNSLSKVDLATGIIDAEHDLWKNLNANTATEAEKIEANITALNKKLSEQNAKVNLAQGEYDFTKATFGDDSDYTREAYKKLIKEQTEAAKLTNEITEEQKNLMDAQQNIADLALKGAELEHELWETMNETNASEIEKLTAQSELLEKKISNQYNKIALAESQYQKALESGESAERVQELYNNVVQAKIDLASLVNESSELNRTFEDTQKEAFNKYAAYLKENYDIMRELGMAHEEIQALARKSSGYDPFATAKPSTTGSDLLAAYSNIGKSCTESLGSGAQSGAASVVESVVNTLDTCTAPIENQRQKWYDCGTQLMQGLIDGINSQAVAIQDAIINNLNAAIEHVNNAMANNTGVISSIRPVFNMSEIQNGTTQIGGLFGNNRTAALAGVNAGYFEKQSSMLSDVLDKVNRTNSENAKIVNAITELRGDFGELVDAISNIQIRMDSKTVVGELIGKIDSGLGQITKHKGRGN